MLPAERALGWLGRLFDPGSPLSSSLGELELTAVPIWSDMLVAGETAVAIAVEIALMLVLVYVLGTVLTRRLLCTACKHPCEHRRGIVRRAQIDSDLARRRIHERDWGFFRDLDRGGEESPRMRFDLTVCTKCRGTNNLTVVLENNKRRDSVLVRDLPLSRDDARTVQAGPLTGTHPPK